MYGTETTEKDRPSLQSSAEKRVHGIPFNPSGQFAHNVGKTIRCTECDRPRVMYAARKVRFRDQSKLEAVLDDIIYTCGMGLQECIPDDISDDEKQSHVLSSVFVRQNMNCDSRIEIPYYSSECFSSVCIICILMKSIRMNSMGSAGLLGSDLHDKQSGYIPSVSLAGTILCSLPQYNKPAVFKRKRKLRAS